MEETKRPKYEPISSDLVWDKAMGKPYNYSQEVVMGKFEEFSKRTKDPRYKGLTNSQQIWQMSRWL